MSRLIQFPFNAGSVSPDGDLGPTSQRDRVAYVVHTDKLTGLYERAVFEDRLSMEMARCNRRGGSLSAMILAVDRFRRLNESEGARAAERVLVSVARYLRETARITDAVGRWGAEQFCMVLPDTELREATLIADHLRETIASQTFDGESGENFKITCSVGVAQWNQSKETTREFPERLERALDFATHLGGDALEAAPYRSAKLDPSASSFDAGPIDPSKWGIPRTFFVVPEPVENPIPTESIS